MTEDVDIAITQLAVFEEAKSQFNLAVLNVTIYDIDIKVRNIVGEIATRLRFLEVFINLKHFQFEIIYL